ncbi:MAG: amidohydrolase family protein [Bryobacterales bacterium]|nr:amidohydrolase family protein [Bryobacterales bacterium]
MQQYFQDNLWITTSAFFRDELLALALATLGEDRIMFSVDYPMASARAGADWIRAVDLPRVVKEKIAHRNAQRLLGIGPI